MPLRKSNHANQQLQPQPEMESPSCASAPNTAEEEANTAARKSQVSFPTGTHRRVPVWRTLFWVALAGILALYWIGGRNTGVHSDEMDMVWYGKANIDWYASGGEDTTFMEASVPGSIPILYNYGSGFEYVAHALTRLLVPEDGWEYGVRHAFNQFVAVIALMFAGLLARRFAGWTAATFTVLVVGLTPTFWGLALFDTKDIPLATGYMATVYFIVRLVEKFPRVHIRLLTGFAISLMAACSIRIGALIVMPLLAGLAVWAMGRHLYLQRGEHIASGPFLQWALAISIALLVALVGTVLAWPYAMLDPLHNMANAMRAATQFPQRIAFTFGGEDYSSLILPKHYLLHALAVTVPLGIMAISLLGLLGLLLNIRRGAVLPLLVLLLAGILPILYADFKQLPVYNNWRHLLFAYPPIVAALVSGAGMLTARARQPMLRAAVWLGLAGGFTPSTLWCLKNQPYQYLYFNEAVGGLAKAAYDYDTDYWQMSLKEGFDWIASREYVMYGKDSVIIASNGAMYGNYYLSKKYPGLKVRVIQSGFKARYDNDWDYALFSNLFLVRDIVKYQWPPAYTAHTISVDDVAMAVILADTARYDHKGITALLQNEPQKADSFFNCYLREIGYRHDLPIYLGKLDGYIGFTRLALGDTVSAAVFAQRSLYTDPTDFAGNITAGLVMMGKGQLQDAYGFLSMAWAVDTTQAVVSQALLELQLRGVR